MRNLKRISNYWNRVEAWRDWRAYEEYATKHGHADLAAKFRPPDDAGWRTIDKRIAQLADALEKLGIPCALKA